MVITMNIHSKTQKDYAWVGWYVAGIGLAIVLALVLITVANKAGVM